MGNLLCTFLVLFFTSKWSTSCFFCKLMSVTRWVIKRSHSSSLVSYKSYNQNSGCIDTALAQEGDRIEQYWQSVLKLLVISCIQLSKWYSISLDSTADEGHVDQLTVNFRYIEYDTPVERFVKFLSNEGHKSPNFFEGLLKFLADHDTEIQKCRWQSYDVGDTVVFKLKCQIQIIMRFGHSVMDIYLF